MTPTPRLGLDIIYIIVSFLGSPELARLSATCKLYHTPALKQLLRCTVELRTNAQLVQFCACVLADVNVRAPWIRTLSVEHGAFKWSVDDYMDHHDISTARIIDFTSVSMLAAVLEHCHNVTNLCVHFLSKLLVADPQLGTAVASLQTIKELTLDYADDSPLIPDLVCNMQSQLRELRIQNHGGNEYLDFPLRDPAAFASTANIEVLCMSNVTFPPLKVQYSPWPNVREMDVVDCAIRMDCVVSIVPNVQTCFLNQIQPHQAVSPLWLDLGFLEVDFATIRHSTWKGCPTRRLDLLTPEDARPTKPNDMDAVIDLLRQSHPLLLSLNTVDAQVGLHFWRSLHVVTPNLRCLEFYIAPTFVSDWVGYLNCLIPFIAKMPLIYLAILVSALQPPQKNESKKLGDLFPTYVLQSFARKIPTLHFLVVQQSEELPGDQSFARWHIIHPQSPGGRRQLKRLAQVPGKELEDRLWEMDRESLLHFDINRFMAST